MLAARKGSRQVSKLAPLSGLLACVALVASDAEAARTPSGGVTLGLTPIAPSQTSWVLAGLLGARPYRLAAEQELPLLERYLEPFRNHTPEARAFFRGAFGPARAPWVTSLCWDATHCERPAFARSGFTTPWGGLGLGLTRPATLIAPEGAGLTSEWPHWSSKAPEPELLGLARARPCPRWKAPRPITILRWAGERETLALTDCDGALLADAVERVSVLARPPGAQRPELPLPAEPRDSTDEGSSDVRLLHPRLLWVLARVAESFPGRALVLMSGYRRDGHGSLHGLGQAVDLYVNATPNEELFAVCRRLRDVGCGYYPNSRFVHIDVRPHGTRHVVWVDASAPGEPSRYADGWPGVLPSGVAWQGSAGPRSPSL